MKHYKLRITFTDDCDEDKVLTFLSKYDTYAYVREVGKKEEKEHCHIYLIVDDKVKDDTLRNRIRALSGSSKGNKLYSLNLMSVDDDKFTVAIEYLAYLMKEGEVRYAGLWIEDDLEEAKRYDGDVKQEMKEKKESRESRSKRIIKEFENYKEGKVLDAISVAEFVIEFFSKENGNISIQTLSSWTNTLLMKYDINGYRRDLVGLILQNITPRR